MIKTEKRLSAAEQEIISQLFALGKVIKGMNRIKRYKEPTQFSRRLSCAVYWKIRIWEQCSHRPDNTRRINNPRRKQRGILSRLYKKSYLSFRRSKATEKSEQKKGFLPAVEMTKALFVRPPIVLDSGSPFSRGQGSREWRRKRRGIEPNRE